MVGSVNCGLDLALPLCTPVLEMFTVPMERACGARTHADGILSLV